MSEAVLVEAQTLLRSLNTYLVIGPVIKRKIFKELGLRYDIRMDNRYCLSGVDPKDVPFFRTPEEVDETYKDAE